MLSNINIYIYNIGINLAEFDVLINIFIKNK